MVRFGIVGVSNTLVTAVSFAILVAGGVPAPAASAAAFCLGAANGYRLNRAWTFRSAARGARTVGRYVAVQGLGALLSGAGVAVLVSDLSLRKLVAEGLVLPFVTLLTYALSRRLVFGGPRLA